MRSFKALGAVLAASAALLAVAPSALAVEAFQAGKYTAQLSGQQTGEHVFTAEGGLTVKCKVATFTSELTELKTELELAPTYSECTAGGVAATVSAEGCKYRGDANATDLDVVCPAGKAIKIVSANCELQVGSQNGLKTVEYTVNDVAPYPTVTANANLTAIKYNKTKDGFLCPFSGTGEKTDGTMSGETLFKGSKASEEVGAFIAPECTNESGWPEEDCGEWESPKSEAELEAGWEEATEEWPEEGSPEEEEAKGHDPILFVHGWNGDVTTFATMIKWFENDGWPKSRLHNWEYEWWRSNAEIAKSVKARAEKLKATAKSNTVDIVAHSMGALSSRYYLKNLEGTKIVEDWVSLAGANKGTFFANLCPLPSCQEMVPWSIFLAALNSNPTPGTVRYKAWWSWCDEIIVPGIFAQLGGKATNKKTKCLRHSEFHEDKEIYEEVRDFVKQ